MAAITPDTVRQENLGSVRLVIANFSAADADDGDTWTSGLKGVVGFWTQVTENPTTQASVGVAATEASGVFTFYPAEDTALFTLFIIHRG